MSAVYASDLVLDVIFKETGGELSMIFLELEETKHMPIRTVYYGIHPTRFGDCFIASVEHPDQSGQDVICHLSFLETLEEWEEPSAIERSKERLRQAWLESNLIQDQDRTAPLIHIVFEGDPATLTLLVRGSQFQLMVWKFLHTIPVGSTIAYAEVAAAIGRPAAARAVARAIAGNNIAYLIPCHRVIRGNGDIHRYRWGVARKHQLLAYEKSYHHTSL